jgi:hypothetical protein
MLFCSSKRAPMENSTVVPQNKRFYFEWLFPFLFRPRAHAQQVAQKRATWLTPLLVVSLLMGVRLWFASPVVVVDSPVPAESVPAPVPGAKGMADTYTISAPAGGGGGGTVVTPDSGGGVEPQVGSATGQIVPILGALAGLWVGWFLLSVLLYVGMVVNGSSNSFTETLNLVGWSSLPLGIRQIPLLIASLAIPSVAANAPGLASLTTSMSDPTGIFLTSLLKLVDVYLVWQVILILLGLGKISPLPARRILGVTFGAVLIFLALAAAPGFLSVIFAQLTQPVQGAF